jgi:hypothetical protein
MSAPIKTKEEIVRLAWTTELRRQGHRKCEHEFDDGGGLVCALGLLREVSGMPHAEAEAVQWNDVNYVGALAGLDAAQSRDSAYLNDGVSTRKHTFSEIADVVEGWFKQ